MTTYIIRKRRYNYNVIAVIRHIRYIIHCVKIYFISVFLDYIHLMIPKHYLAFVYYPLNYWF